MVRTRYSVRTRLSQASARSRGKRERFRVVVNVPQREHGTAIVTEDRVLDDANKIFRSLVESGRLSSKK